MVLSDHGFVELADDVFVVGTMGDEAIKLGLLGANAVLHVFVKL